MMLGALCRVVDVCIGDFTTVVLGAFGEIEVARCDPSSSTVSICDELPFIESIERRNCRDFVVFFRSRYRLTSILLLK